jgi:hypothetical protein
MSGGPPSGSSSRSLRSRASAAARASLGVVLFERTPRGVVLTDDGEKFLEKAQRVLAAADDALGGRQAIEVGGRLALGLPLDRGLGSAGVALDPAPPKGATYTLQPSTLKSAAPAIAHPSKLRGVVTLTQEQFNYGFTNMWEKADAEAAYERYAVPETGRIFFQDGLANFSWNSPAEIDYENSDRAPLLITVGEHDNTVPPKTGAGQLQEVREVRCGHRLRRVPRPISPADGR